MSFKLKKITIDNLLSAGHIELELEDLGLVLLDGINNSDPSLKSNGAFKSGIVGSIYYAVYGSFPSGVTADAVINRKVGKGAKAELIFERDGKEYRIVRSRKKNAVKLYCGEDDLTTNSTANTDKLIKEVFGISEQLFTNTILFDSINSQRFATLGDKARKEMLVELLNLGIYTHAHELAKADKKALEEVQTQLQNNKRNVMFEIETFKRLHEEEKQKAQQQSSGYKSAMDAVTASEQALAEYLSIYTPQAVEALENELQALQGQLTQYMLPPDTGNEAELNKAQSVIREIDMQVSNLRTKLTTVDNQRNHFSQTDLCPTCGNEMDAEHKAMELEKLTVQENEILVTYKELMEKKEVALADVQRLTVLVDAEKAQKLEVQNNFQAINQQVQQKNTELSTIKNQMYMKEVAVTKAKEVALAYEEAIIPTDYTADIEKKQKEVEEIDKQLLANTHKILSADLAIKTYSDTGVKSHVMELSAPFLNERISEYLNVLSGGTIKAVIKTQKDLTSGGKSDKIDLVISNEQGADSYKGLSAGEKRRVDISISLALQDLVMKQSNLAPNLLMYDEVFENLDEVGCENVIELLKKRLDVAGSIIVISHSEHLKPLFNNVITVVKDDGLSTLK